MASKPLGYESLKCILQYMDANQRFQIFQHCPSIRATEKLVPLKIDRLEFQQTQMCINNTKYLIEIYRKYNNGSTPRMFPEENGRSDITHGVNKYGMHDRADWVTLMPGDIDINDLHIHRGHPRASRDRTPNEEMTQIEETIRNNEEDLTRGVHQETINGILEKKRLELLPYQYWKNNVEPPYEHFIQITVTCNNRARIERYHHNKKFREAWKQLTTFIFAGRRSSIQVNTLRLECGHGIIRLPVDVKFKVDGLQFQEEVAHTCARLSPVIDPASFPLKVLDLVWPFMSEVAHHPVVKQAKQLVFSHIIAGDQTLPMLLRLSNQKVCVRFASVVFSAESMIGLIQNWKTTSHSIGTCYEFVFFKYEDMNKHLERIGKEFPEAVRGERSITLPMSDTSQLEFSYTNGISHGRIPIWTLAVLVAPLIINY